MGRASRCLLRHARIGSHRRCSSSRVLAQLSGDSVKGVVYDKEALRQSERVHAARVRDTQSTARRTSAAGHT